MCAKFSLGQVVATPAALDAISECGQTPAEFLDRHVSGDWGDLDDEDRRLNDEALVDGGRIFSAYILSDGKTKVWLISEANRSSTACISPSEY